MSYSRFPCLGPIWDELRAYMKIRIGKESGNGEDYRTLLRSQGSFSKSGFFSQIEDGFYHFDRRQSIEKDKCRMGALMGYTHIMPIHNIPSQYQILYREHPAGAQLL